MWIITIIMPTAIGCMVTGLIYAQLTNWGYLKFYWIIVKGTANLIFLLAGFFWFIPWLERMAETSLSMRNYLAVDPSYEVTMYIHMAMVFSQAALVFFLVIIPKLAEALGSEFTLKEIYGSRKYNCSLTEQH